MTTHGHDAKRVAEYVLWLAKDNPITPMQLLKLVYLSHGWMLGLYSRPLIQDAVQAWEYGPVVPSVYHRYKKYGGGFIKDVPDSEPTDFSAKERQVMRQVWEQYGELTGLRLSALTHQRDSPWDITRRTVGLGEAISNDLIEQHYHQLAQR